MVDLEVVAEGLLTVTASAEFLGLSRSKLYQLMDRGELRYVKIGRARRLPRRALLEFAARHVTGGWNVDGLPTCQ